MRYQFQCVILLPWLYWFDLFFLEHLFCGSNCESTFCNVRKGTFQKKIRLRRFITRNLHISKGWHRKQRFVDHIKSFLFFIFVSEVDGKYLLVFAKSFRSSCSGENSDPVALILCLGPKKILGSFDPSEGKIPLRKNASSDVGKNVVEQIVDSKTRPGIFDLFAKNKNMFPQKIPVRIIGRWTSFFPSQYSLMCQHLLQRNCSLNQAKNFFCISVRWRIVFLPATAPPGFSWGHLKNEEDTCVKISYNIWLTWVSVSPLGDNLYLSLTHSFKNICRNKSIFF